MRHRVGGRKFSMPTGPRKAMFRNLVTDLLKYEAITTTEAKAKEIQPMAEKIITLGKDGTLHARRQAAAYVYDALTVKKLFDVFAERYTSRAGGYTRITKLGTREGDGARIARIELVDRPE